METCSNIEAGVGARSALDRHRISVAMAVYNGEKYIAEQLASLSRQTYLPCELAITDDGSTDKTADIVRTFSEDAPFPVHYHRNEKRYGYADNFLKAATLCRGDWVAFADQDDVWADTKLEVCGKYLHDKDLTVVVHSADVWTGNELVGHRFPTFLESRVCSPGNVNCFMLIPGFAMVFRRDLLELTDNYDRPGCLFGLDNGSIMAHDGWIWLLGTTTGKVATLRESLALYRQHGANSIGAPKLRSLAETMKFAAGAVNYDRLAAFEMKCAEVVGHIPEGRSPRFVKERQVIVEQMMKRASMHTARTEVYKNSSPFHLRMRSFVHILLVGGYLPDKTKGRLGPQSALKDLFYGVSGIYKYWL